MTTQVEWISHEAAELPQLAEWDAHLACDFRPKGWSSPTSRTELATRAYRRARRPDAPRGALRPRR